MGGGEENERQMATNVMREIGIVMGTWYVDFLHRLPGNGARNPFTVTYESEI